MPSRPRTTTERATPTRGADRSLIGLAFVLLVTVQVGACDGWVDGGPAGPRGVDTVRPVGPATLVLPPPTLHRLTRDEYVGTLEALLPEGVVVPDDLPGDTPLHGFATIGGGVLTLPPRDVEQYEAAAYAVVEQVQADPARRAAFFGCDVAAEGAPCVRAFLTRFGRRAWRRPLEPDELDALVSVARDVGALLRDPWRGAGFATAALLQSPNFLFRVETGEPDPGFPSRLRYTGLEMASRLSYLLWQSGPDEALLQAAAEGALHTEEGLRVQIGRMSRDPRSQRALAAFFAEFMSLDRLGTVSKDPGLFPEFTDALRDSMRAEIELVFADVVARDADVRELFSTDVTFVDQPLAALYGLPDPGPDARVRATLPASAQRGGLMGRAGVLSMWAHATLNSPTLRGKFVRANLLCQDIPPPPPGVSTTVAEGGTGPETLRTRLDRHRTDAVCAGCHDLMDPLGFTLEHFDPIGRRRELDQGLAIDASGSLDGAPIDGAAALGQALRDSPRVGACFARRFFRWGTGRLETRGELAEVDRIAAAFGAAGHRMGALVELVVLSPAFRFAGYPPGECTDGASRDCGNACGPGTQRCERGAWTACSAPPGAAEACNGADDDCDGTADEGVTRPCETACGMGLESCVAGAFASCSARAPAAEACNHADEDCDGQVDEGFGGRVVSSTYTALRAVQPVCDGAAQRMGLECNVAIHGLCGTSAATCGTSGFGPVENSGDTAVIACLSATLRTTSFAELASRHDGCNGTTMRAGPQCNAAVHRHCAALGLGTGYGPVDVSGSTVTVACVPDAERIDTTFTAMAARHAGCTSGSPYSGPCNAAIHRECVARGAASGFGPLEHSGDFLQIACVRR